MKLTPGSIDELLAPYGPKVVALANAARRRMLTLVPHAVERLRAGWGLIGYSAPKYFAFIVPVKDGVRPSGAYGSTTRPGCSREMARRCASSPSHALHSSVVASSPS